MKEEQKMEAGLEGLKIQSGVEEQQKERETSGEGERQRGRNGN